MANYLITGGCGFIGSHLVELLLEKNQTPIVLDNLYNGKRDNIPASVEFIEGDVCDLELVSKLMTKVDGCFHLAAIASVQACDQEWLHAHQVNVVGTINTFVASQRTNPDAPKPVIFTSSSAIYGHNQDLPYTESAYPMPFSAYGADKRGCELHGKIAADVHKCNVPH